MNNINILDSSVFNRIAAGEVVERPSSVVKELLDNSIDAKSTKISIEIIGGGIKEIKISDNGSGIEPDDFDRVFLPHATSKIKTTDDLDKIGTLGFRGEALASISAVSKVLMKSRTERNELGKEILIEGGNVVKSNEIGFDKGTTFVVNDIFYNVPARAKFLKSAKQETAEITNLVAKYILANPFISFKFVSDGKEIYFSTGNGLEDAIFVVYGKETLKNLVKVNYKSANGIMVSGYVSNPTFSKPNRTYQTLIINGRYVVNQMVSLCIYNAFEHYLMKGQFPFFVINLDIPLDKLDVNVHPNKLDVRFENGNEIYGVVYLAVSNAIKESNNINMVTKNVFEYKEVTSGVSFNPNKDNSEKPSPIIIVPQEDGEKLLEDKTEKINVTEDFNVDNIEKINENKMSSLDFYSSFSKNENSLKQNNTRLTNVFDKIKNQEDVIKEESYKEQKVEQDSIFNENIKYIGNLFDTYLLVQNEERVYIIDQHAAHERLLYDELVKQLNNKEVVKQMLLIPYVLNLNSLEYNFIEQNLNNFENLGFEIEEFGDLCFKVSAVPNILKNGNPKQVFDGILSDLTMFKSLKQADLITEKLMQSACKHAVKAGDMFSTEKVSSLIKQMKEEQMLLQCPHGRPVVIELTKSELEKWFKRIV